MPSFHEDTFLSVNRKTDIFYRICLPDTSPVGTVQIAHGIAEHSLRYRPFMEFLASNGYVVIVNDHLGHGKSITGECDLGFFAEDHGWDMVIGDMHTLFGIITERYPNLPHFLFGHSMGSFLARTYLFRYPDDFSGAIISGTGQQSALTILGGKLMGQLEIACHGAHYQSSLLNQMAFGSYNKTFEPRRTDYDWLTSREDIVDAYAADPLCGFIPSAGLFTDMMEGIGLICSQKNVNKMNKDTPIFFLSGGKDPVGANGKGVNQAYRSFLKAGMKRVSLKLYPKGRHEMLNESNYEEVYQDILNWLKEA